MNGSGISVLRAHPTPDADVPLLGFANMWLRQLLAQNYMYMNRGKAERMGLKDDD